jgi:hypothetical protein
MKPLRPLAVATLLALSPFAALALDEPLPKDTLRHYYRLFSDTCYLAPTSLQAETLAVAERVFQAVDGWQAPTDEEYRAATRACLDHYDRVKQEYPFYTVSFDKEGASLKGDTPTLLLGVGLPSIVLVEVANQSGVEIHFNTLFREAGSNPQPPILLADGATLPILVPVQVMSDGLEDLTLSFVPAKHGDTVHDVTIPARVLRPATIVGTTIDAATGQPFPSRIYAAGGDGIYRRARELAENSTVSEKQVVFRPAMIRVPFSYTDGAFTVDVTPGDATLTLERGFETPLVKESITVEPGEQREITIASQRAFDMKAKGWYSGDTHIHWATNMWNQNEDLDLLARVQRAEDLRVVNNLTLFQFQPDNQSFLKPDQYPMGPIAGMCDEEYHVQMAEEYRNDNHYGHINLLNLKELIVPVATGPGSGGPPDAIDFPQNKTIIEEARRQGGISIEAHNLGPFHASGVVVNVVQGYSDSLDQLEPRHYYSFLNSGIRIGLSNGSDHPARLAGICRVYVHAPGPLDYENWCRRLAEGRTFTTSGPLLLLTVGDANVGDELEVEKGDTLSINVSAWSRHPLGRVEVVSNDQVIATIETQATTETIAMEIVVDEPRWIVARASRSDSFDALSGPDIAHTSAVYVNVDGRGVFKPEAAQGWIANAQQHRARLVEKANFENDDQRAEALAHIDAGIARYQQLIDEHASRTSQ